MRPKSAIRSGRRASRSSRRSSLAAEQSSEEGCDRHALEWETVVGSRFHGERVGAVEGSVEYRIGYHIVNRKGRWHWGQYALMIPAEDLRGLFAKAFDEGTIRPEDLSLP